jgi:tetratricopeptide (TPR) repeat protein
MTSCLVSNSAELELKIELNKPSYLESEPILLVISIKNNGNLPIDVAEPLVREGFITLVLFTDQGSEPKIPALSWDLAMPSSDYKVCLQPNGVLKSEWSLTERYPLGLPIGAYVLKCSYNTKRFLSQYPNIWHGILTQEITLSVAEPSPDEKEAYMLLRKAQAIITENEKDRYPEARESLIALAKKHPNSVYTPYSIYLLAKNYSVMQSDKTQYFNQAIPYYRSFLEKYPKYPYYSRLIGSIELPFALYSVGETNEAREILENSLDGLHKQRLMQLINKNKQGLAK